VNKMEAVAYRALVTLTYFVETKADSYVVNVGYLMFNKFSKVSSLSLLDSFSTLMFWDYKHQDFTSYASYVANNIVLLWRVCLTV